jgi:hypothetical protein
MAIGHAPRLKYNEPVGYNENRVQPVVSAASLCCDRRLMLSDEDRSKGDRSITLSQHQHSTSCGCRVPALRHQRINCRSFATISSAVHHFLAITLSLYPKKYRREDHFKRADQLLGT